MALHSDPIAEDGSACEGRVGVGSDHTHRLSLLPEQGDHRIDQRRLACPRRAGETSYMTAADQVAQRLLQLSHFRVAPFDEADGSGQGPDVARAETRGQLWLWD
jgi:hypothetical protein